MKLPEVWDSAVLPRPRVEQPSRYRNRNVAGERLRAVMMIALLYGGAAIGLLVKFGNSTDTTPPSPAPLAAEIFPLAAPPAPVHEVKEGPEQVEQPKAEAIPSAPVAVPPVAPVLNQPAAVLSEPVRAAPQPWVPETTAPKSLPAPPAPALSSDARDSWEARLLAHLERYRRFPLDARARREEGVVNVRFRMNRSGRLLAARILRSSGSPALDRAALDTLRRAQPLPAIPDDMPDEVGLDLPVAFYLK